MPRVSRFVPLALLAALLAAAPAAANCTASTVPVAFGAYTPTATTAKDGVGTVTIACTTDAKNVSIALGTGGSGSYAARRLTNGTSSLTYNLYTDTARSILWGNGSGGTSAVSVARINKTSVSRTVYGRIPASQNVTAGTYSDTLIVTVVF